MSVKRVTHDIDSGKVKFTLTGAYDLLDALDILSDMRTCFEQAYKDALYLRGCDIDPVSGELKWNGNAWEIK